MDILMLYHYTINVEIKVKGVGSNGCYMCIFVIRVEVKRIIDTMRAKEFEFVVWNILQYAKADIKLSNDRFKESEKLVQLSRLDGIDRFEMINELTLSRRRLHKNGVWTKNVCRLLYHGIFPDMKWNLYVKETDKFAKHIRMDVNSMYRMAYPEKRMISFMNQIGPLDVIPLHDKLDQTKVC